MKFTSKSLLFILVTCASATSAWSQAEQSQLPADIVWDITEGKISAVMINEENELRKSVDEKQLKAIQLINIVSSKVNERFSNDLDKEEAGSAYEAFITRFQIIHDEREALDKKEIMADYKTLQNYSKRLDRLILDIQKFLK